jgi:Na+/melibiose symporter-like transporter
LSSPSTGYQRQLSLPTALTFSLANLPVAALYVAIGVYLPPFFATHVGVGLSVVGVVFMIVRLIDIPIDFLLGLAMDKTRTPIGRYRAWLVGGAPILMAACFMLFMAPKGAGATYLVGWLLVLYLGNSILHLSHSAWTATLATNYHERSRVFGVLAAIGVVGALCVLAIPIVSAQMGRNGAQSVNTMGWFFIVSVPLTVAIVASRIPERITVDHSAEKFTLADYRRLLSKPSLVRVLLADLGLALGPGWMSAMYIFFFTDSRGFTVSQASILLGVYVAAGLLGAPIVSRVAMIFGKHRTVMATTTLYSLGLCCVILPPKGVVLAYVPVMFWCGFMAAGFNLLTRAMVADIGDEVRLEQGKERVSLLYALTTLTSKVAGAFSIGLTLTVLAALGYQAKEGVQNTPEAIRALEAAFLIGPIFFVMLGGACFIGYKLDARRHAEIRSELEARDKLYDETPAVDVING